MREVSSRGLHSVLSRLKKQCEHAGKYSFKFSNYDDSVDFYLCMVSRGERRFELRMVVDVFLKNDEEDADNVKHPAVWAWLMERYDGDNELYNWGPINEDFEEFDVDIRPEVLTKIKRMQSLKMCPCHSGIFFDDAAVCLACDFVATDEDCTLEKCCICQDAVYKFHAVKTACCLHMLHRSCCSELINRHDEDGECAPRCPMCRAPFVTM